MPGAELTQYGLYRGGAEVEVTEKIATLEVGQARLDERVSDLEDWRKKVNGHLERIEARLNAIGWGIAATLGGVVVDLILRIAGR